MRNGALVNYQFLVVGPKKSFKSVGWFYSVIVLVLLLHNKTLPPYFSIILVRFDTFKLILQFRRKGKKKNYFQGSKGIRQMPINWCTAPMMTQKITHSVNCHYWLKHLDTQLNESTNQIQVLKLVQPMKSRNCKTLGTSVINNKMSSLSLIILSYNFN